MKNDFLYNGMLDVVVQSIIDATERNEAVTIEYIVENSEYEKVSVLKAISLLEAMGLLNKVGNEFTLLKNIQATNLVSAGQINLRLEDFSYFEVDPKQKKLALELSTQKDTVKNLDVLSRAPLIQSRGYLIGKSNDEVYQTLALIFESSSSLLHDYITVIAKKDSKLKLLLEMHGQAEKALIKHVEKMK